MKKIEDLTPKKGKATIISQDIGDTLYQIRKDHGLTQSHVADFMEVTFQQYQKYEKSRDRISLEKAILFCSKLGLSLDVFIKNQPAQRDGFTETNHPSFLKGGVQLSPDDIELLNLFRTVPNKSQKALLAMLNSAYNVIKK